MKMRAASWINFGALILVNLLWAAQYPAYKIAGDHMEAATLNFWMLIFASVLLAPFWLHSKRAQSTAAKTPFWKTVWQFLLLSVLGIIPPSVMLSWGISRSSASNAAILSLTIPVLMTGLGILMLGEKLSLARVFSVLLGLVGTLLVSTSDLSQASFSRNLLIGNGVILIAGLGSAFYNTYSKELLGSYSEIEVLIYSYLLGAIACALISVAMEGKPFYQVAGYSTSTWVAVAFLGALPWGVAMVLWMWVLKRLEVGQISTSIYLLPFFGLILSIITVHEHITFGQIIGGGLTVAGTGMLTLAESKRSQAVTEYTSN